MAVKGRDAGRLISFVQWVSTVWAGQWFARMAMLLISMSGSFLELVVCRKSVMMGPRVNVTGLPVRPRWVTLIFRRPRDRRLVSKLISVRLMLLLYILSP